MDYEISRFDLGLRTELPPRLLPMGACQYSRNALFGRNTIRVRPPRRLWSTTPSAVHATKGLRSLMEFERHNVSPTSRLVGAIGRYLVASDDDTQTLSDYILLDTIVNDNNPLRMASVFNNVYFADGDNYIQRWAGGAVFDETVFQEYGVGPGPSISDDAAYTGTEVRVYTIEITKAGIRYDSENPTAAAEFDWKCESYPDGATVQEATGVQVGVGANSTNTLRDGLIIEWRRTSFVLHDRWKIRGTPDDYVELIDDKPSPAEAPDIEVVAIPESIINCKVGSTRGHGGLADAFGGPYEFQSYLRSTLLADISGDFNGDTVNFATDAAIPDVCARIFTQEGNWLTDGKAFGMEFLTATDPISWGGVTAWGWSTVELDAELNLSQVNSLDIYFKIVAGDQETFTGSALYIELGPSHGALGTHLASIVKVDLTGVGANEWVTRTVDISGLTEDERKAITCAALAFYSDAQKPADRLEPTSASAFDTGTYEITTYPYAVTLLVDRIAPAGANERIPVGGYDFVYTYAFYDGAMLKEGPMSPVATVNVTNPWTMSFEATMKMDSAVEMTDNDKLYLYARGGESSEYRRVKEIAVDPDEDEYVESWDGVYTAAMRTLRPFLNAPPKGCQLLEPYFGRMLYVEKDSDWLRISNWAEPWYAPDQSVLDLYDFYGGKMRVGEDGSSITAMRVLESYALIFKEKGIWLLEGTKPPFSCVPLSDSCGTTAPDSVRQLRGNACAWLDSSGRVMAWDGQQIIEPGEIEERGCPIAENLKVYTAAQLQSSFSVYDEREQRYLLWIPAGATVGADCYVYERLQGCWSQHNNQPASCACYAKKTDTPGIYAGDADQLKLYLLFGDSGGTVDESSRVLIWHGGELDPRGDTYKDIAVVSALLSPASDDALTMRLYANHDGAASAASGALNPLEEHIVPWRPAPISDAMALTLYLTATVSSDDDFEVQAVAYTIAERGRVRGRPS